MTEAILGKWDNLVIKTLISENGARIRKVKNYTVAKFLFFDKTKYSLITSLITKGDWNGLELVEDTSTSNFREYLSIIKFSDQHGAGYVATVYDSDELWQDPKIIDIFRFT